MHPFPHHKCWLYLNILFPAGYDLLFSLQLAVYIFQSKYTLLTLPHADIIGLLTYT